jgi:two-component sensor histidine kinase
VVAAQSTILGTTLAALALAGIFAERRHHELAARENGARLRSILDAANVLAWEVDLVRNAVHSAGPVRRLLDRRDGSVPPDFAAMVETIHPNHRDSVMSKFWTAVSTARNFRLEFRLNSDALRWVTAEGSIERDADGQPARVRGITHDITERKEAEEQQSLLIAELDHRVKNVLATVAVVTKRTSEHTTSTNDFIDALDHRLQSMAAAHSLLSRNHWRDVSLADLIAQEVAPYAASGNAMVEGPTVYLTAATIQAMAMVLHELATNAAKYGALSTPQGQVSVRWHLLSDGEAPAKLRLEWHETGGPVVPPNPSRIRHECDPRSHPL